MLLIDKKWKENIIREQRRKDEELEKTLKECKNKVKNIVNHDEVIE